MFISVMTAFIYNISTINKITKSNENSILMYKSKGEEYIKVLAKKDGEFVVKSNSHDIYSYDLKANEMIRFKVNYEDEKRNKIVLLDENGNNISLDKTIVENFMFETQ